MNWKKTLIICASILTVAVVVTYIIFSTEPEAIKEGATKRTAMLVDTIRVNKGTFTPEISLTGIVQPEQEVMISPRITGEITRIAPEFVPGGRVRKGQALAYIDPTDFKNNLLMRESELAQAKAELELEKGRQEAAKQEYKLAGQELSEEKKALVLRQPQMQVIKARIDAATAAVEQARAELDRTVIKAPFNAQIISRNVNVGSQVSPGNTLARITGINNYWIILTLPSSKLKWLSFPEKKHDRGSEVIITNRTAWPDTISRTGYLFRSIGNLDDQTRLARVIAEVPDPLGLKSESPYAHPLLIGSFVQATVKANQLAGVVRLNRDFLRKNNTVWVMKDDKLEIRKVNTIISDDKYAYISSGLEHGENVITTNLATVVDGAPLRTVGNDDQSNEE